MVRREQHRAYRFAAKGVRFLHRGVRLPRSTTARPDRRSRARGDRLGRSGGRSCGDKPCPGGRYFREPQRGDVAIARSPRAGTCATRRARGRNDPDRSGTALGRRPAEPSSRAAVQAALDAVADARIVVASTPIYRATYSGLLKVFFDLLPPDALVGKVGVPIAIGGAAGHLLAIDHGLRPLFASVGAIVVGTGIYATEKQFRDGTPDSSLLERLTCCTAEALALATTQRLLTRDVGNPLERTS
jgi:NAD(P)H-dependent FMN reductase